MPQSKFGGIPVEDEKPKAGGSKFGGVPVEEPAAPQETMAPAQPQTVGHAATEFGRQINPIPMITGALSTIAHPLDTARSIYNAQANELGQVPKLVREGRYSEAVGHGTAGLIPLVGPAAAKIGETIGGTEPTFDKYGTVIKPGQAPDPAGGIGAGAGLITSVLAAPRVTNAVGRGFQGIARPIVKSALGLPGKAEAYGANPAAAVLEDTRGVRPATIARTGQQRISDLTNELDTAVANTTARPSLKPARDILNRESTSSAGFNSEQTPREISRMSKQLTEPRPGFKGATEFPQGAHTPISFRPAVGMAPGPPRLVRGVSPEPIIAADQPASEFLGMKRQFDKDFISNWNPTANTKHGLGVARQAYNAMADELNRTVPGAERINGRIQSLIPAVDRAETVAHNAGAVQKVIDRFSRPTGALTPALIGERIGGIPGALAGLGLTEAVSDPMAKMLAARGLYGTGRLLRSPVVTRGSQVMPLLRQNQ